MKRPSKRGRYVILRLDPQLGDAVVTILEIVGRVDRRVAMRLLGAIATIVMAPPRKVRKGRKGGAK